MQPHKTDPDCSVLYSMYDVISRLRQLLYCVNIECDLAGEFVLKVLNNHNYGLQRVNTAEVRLRIYSRARVCKLSNSPGIDSQPGGPVRQPYSTVFVVPELVFVVVLRGEKSIPGID